MASCTDDPLPRRAARVGRPHRKEITTPEYYPLSLNSLQAAANQRSSREPVTDLTEEEIRSALGSLEQLGLVTPVRDARVPKFEHRVRTVLNLRRDETALLCLLLLRGPQTPGELRSRADRLHSFDDLDAVTATLNRLAAPDRAASSAGPSSQAASSHAGPLIRILPRQPGARESRYAHLLGDTSAAPSQTPATDAAALATPDARIAALEHRLTQLEQRLAALEHRS